MLSGKKGNIYLNLQLKGVGLFFSMMSKGLSACSLLSLVSITLTINGT